MGAKGDWDFRNSDLDKNPHGIVITPVMNFGEIRRAQLAKSTRLTSMLLPPGSFQKVCSDAKERVGCGKQREATASIQSLIKLQPWFLSLRWKTAFGRTAA